MLSQKEKKINDVKKRLMLMESANDYCDYVEYEKELLKIDTALDNRLREDEDITNELEKLAYEYNLPLIDIREPFLKIRDYKSYLCVDGIHLNEKGQSIMCSTFKNYAAAM